MSGLKDAMAALKSVLIMQTQIEHMDKAIENVANDMGKMRQVMNNMDKRLVRIETMVEMSTGRARGNPALPDK